MAPWQASAPEALRPLLREFFQRFAEQNGAAAEKGISSGDIILEVAGKPVSRPSEVKAEIASARHEGKGGVLFKLRSAETSRYVAFALPKA